MANLTGQYHLTKPTELTGNKITLVLCTRRNILPGKSSKYLLEKTENKSFRYVSSLYPVCSDITSETYQLEKGGFQYILTINRAQLTASIEVPLNNNRDFAPNLAHHDSRD